MISDVYVIAGELVNTIHNFNLVYFVLAALLSSSSRCLIVKSQGCESIYFIKLMRVVNMKTYCFIKDC